MRKDCQFHWFEHELWETLCSYINKIISLQAPLLYCVFDHFVLLHKIPNICRSYSYFSMLFRCSLVLVQLLLVSFVLLKAHANGRNKSQHCCVLLGVFGQQCYVRLQEPKSLTGFKLYATSANKCQQVPTSANIVVVPCKHTQQVTTLLRVVGGFWTTMLRPFAWA